MKQYLKVFSNFTNKRSGLLALLVMGFLLVACGNHTAPKSTQTAKTTTATNTNTENYYLQNLQPANNVNNRNELLTTGTETAAKNVKAVRSQLYSPPRMPRH